MPVGELLRRFTSPELTELLALYDLRARPPQRAQTPQEMRAALKALSKRGKKNAR